MNNKLVYLAGPITGISYDDCTSWREYVMKALKDNGIKGLSPMRSKSYLRNRTSIDDTYNEHILSTQRTIYSRDKWDATRCDVLFVNLLGAKTVSIGTVMEIAWASLQHKPIVLVMEKENNIHEHAMLREACCFRVDNLNDGIFVLCSLFQDE